MTSVQNAQNTTNTFHGSLPYIVGLTGGIGSGKTAVSDWFLQQAIDVVDADVVAHQVVEKGSATLANLVQAFGGWILDAQGNLNRKALRDHVFRDNLALRTLESITHPAIREEITKQLQQARSAYVMLSAPLLLEAGEAGLKQLCNRILVVDVHEDTQLARASKRDGQSAQQIRAIMAKQLPRAKRVAQADDVVNNDGSLPQLYDQLTQLHHRYLQLATP